MDHPRGLACLRSAGMVDDDEDGAIRTPPQVSYVLVPIRRQQRGDVETDHDQTEDGDRRGFTMKVAARAVLCSSEDLQCSGGHGPGAEVRDELEALMERVHRQDELTFRRPEEQPPPGRGELRRAGRRSGT